jgi:hypothetical protein
MYNYTKGGEKWKTALNQYLDKLDRFYPEDKGFVMAEPCEHNVICNADQESFKAYLARWLGVTIQMAPIMHDKIMPRLTKSAVRAAQTCVGPSQHNGGPYQCGMRWYVDGFDGKGGVGPQMTALNIISVLNVNRVKAPIYSSDNGKCSKCSLQPCTDFCEGGTSQGNPNLGTGDDASRLPVFEDDITTGDKAGAAIVTVFVVVLWAYVGYWMVS